MAGTAVGLHIGKPHVLRYKIQGGKLTGENGLGSDKLWGHPSRHVTFTIQNDDDTDYLVRIPASGFEPSKQFNKGLGDAPAHPISRSVFRPEEVVVESNDTAVIVLKLKGDGFFKFGVAGRPPAFTYKYTVYWKDESGGVEQDFDPDLEVSS